MFISIQRAMVLIFFMLLMSCSSLSKSQIVQIKSKPYLYAKSIPPLKIPPGISSDAFHNQYPVSDHDYPESAKAVSAVPPGLYDK